MEVKHKAEPLIERENNSYRINGNIIVKDSFTI